MSNADAQICFTLNKRYRNWKFYAPLSPSIGDDVSNVFERTKKREPQFVMNVRTIFHLNLSAKALWSFGAIIVKYDDFRNLYNLSCSLPNIGKINFRVQRSSMGSSF
ncbi:hypothetical protein NPIL_658741 [Nephila pilipes]|uniref:Uncharacterized protein n=1 Tax=Nephila pilipes TaxID=299642 RepID=A0A8X6PJE9_NEPPI|nr:hypothetical protein NPIL_658741 [Nephila pilipes]